MRFQDDDASAERIGPKARRTLFQHARTFDDADLQRNGRGGGEGVSYDNNGRGYYTVGRPPNLAYQSRSKSLQASPTAHSFQGDPHQEARVSGPGGPFWSEEAPVASSPRRIPITVRHEPPSQTLPRLSRFNSEGSQSVHNQDINSHYNQGVSQPSYHGQYEQQQEPQNTRNQYHRNQYNPLEKDTQQPEYSQFQQQPQQSPQNQKQIGQWQPSASRNIPILPRRTRRFSEEDTLSSSHPLAEEAPSKLSSSWQSPGSLQYNPRGPGAYATLPSKGSQQRLRQQQQQHHQHQHHHQQQQQHNYQQHPQQKDQHFFDRNGASNQSSSEPIPVPIESYGSLPTIKPLKSSTTLSNLSDTRRSENTSKSSLYSSSFPGRYNFPAFKTSQSSFEFGDLRDLEHTLDDPRKDFSKPLWANTDFDKRSSQRSSICSSLGDDGHSPHSDNAVSSSDSRDTIIAKEEKAASDFFSSKRNVSNFSNSKSRMQQDEDFQQEGPKLPYHQGAQQDPRAMDYKHGYQMQHSSSNGDPRPQHRLGPPTSPKPERRVPVTVVHEHSVPPPRGHVNDGVRGSDGYESFSQDHTPYPSSHPAANTSDFRQNGPPANEFHGISYAPSKPADNWGTQTLPARAKVEGRESKPSPTESSLRNIAPVWKPSGSGVSSLTIKKEYKPVRLDTSKKPVQKEEKKYPEQVDNQSWRPQPRGAPAEPPSFPSLPPHSLDTSTDSVLSSSSSHVPPPPPPALSNSSTSSSLWATATDYTDQSDITLVSSVVQPRHMNGGAGDREESHGSGEDSRLPPTQSPYITLLKKSRDTEENEDMLNTKFVHKPIMVKDDGQLPKGATYIGSQHKVEGDRSVTEDYYTTPVSGSGSDNTSSSQRVVEHKPVKYDGIGPLDNEGVPLANRKNVTEENQKQWYKQMYKSLHSSGTSRCIKVYTGRKRKKL
ncbi:hypothetical protein EGW08_011821 [Elysia chlorotica]|uniref:SoHo domain-containing protein n=1 Tax=Elysia chlorotica TaxID=188477 RepID=A0A3S0ZQH9_ELYCH|nr:hypothetical protein EGW08_011821 [Elysia chlorotica]